MGKGYLCAFGAIWAALFIAVKPYPLALIPAAIALVLLVIRGAKRKANTLPASPAQTGLALSFHMSGSDDISITLTNITDAAITPPPLHIWLSATATPDGMPGFGGNGFNAFQTNFDPNPIGVLDGGQSVTFPISNAETPFTVVPYTTPLRKFSSHSDEEHAERESHRMTVAQKVAKRFDEAPSLAALLRQKESPFFLEARLEGYRQIKELNLQPLS